MRNAGERAYPVTVGSAPEFKRERGERGEGEEKNEREGRGEEKE